MEKLLYNKLTALVNDLHNAPEGKLKANEFDHSNPHAKIERDSRGSRWNIYVHQRSDAFGFKIIKHRGRNTYVLVSQ